MPGSQPSIFVLLAVRTAATNQKRFRRKMRASLAPVEAQRMRGRLGPYDILAPLGSGGMGEVYRARDRRLDRLVAIKVIKTTHHDDARARERFDREAKVVAALDHPHICALYDVGHEDGIDYLVMQYLEGDTLASRLHGGPLPIADALKYASQIAHAIDAAHKRGITHRDLKPSNVMLTRMGAILLDFGLAKLSGAAPDGSSPTTTVDLTREGAIVGTVRYMAPEVLERRGADVRSDLFSFGAILHEMITGRRAFEGDSDARVMVSILNERPKPLRTYRPDAPPELQQIVDGCLAKNPEERWETARDVAMQIDAIAPSHTTTPLPISSGTLRMYRAQPRWVAAVVAVGALGAAGTSVLWSRYAAPVAAPPPHLVTLPCRAADPANQAFCDGFNEALLDRLARLTLTHRLQVTRQPGGPSRRVATVNDARTLSGATHVIEAVADEHNITYTLSGPDGTTANFAFDTADVFDAEERAIFWALRELAVEIGQDERENLVARATQHRDARLAFLKGRGFLLRSSNAAGFETASASFDKAIALDSGYALAYFGSGMAWRARFLIDQDPSSAAMATAACKASIEKEPGLSEGHTCLGMMLSALRNFEDGANELARGVQLDKTNDAAIVALGRAQEALHRPTDAERTYRTAIDSRPGYFLSHVWAADFYSRLSRYEDTVRELESAIALVPHHGPINAALTAPLVFLGRYDEALAAADKAISIAPTRPAFVAKSNTLFRMRRYEEAASAAELAHALGPTDPTLLIALARAYYWIDTIESRAKAEAFYREAAIQLQGISGQNPSPEQLVDQRITLADIYAKLNRPEDARTQLQLAGLDPASTERPTDSHQLFWGALVFAQIGDSDAAIRWLERATYWGVRPAELRAFPELDGLRNQQGFRDIETAHSNDSGTRR